MCFYLQNILKISRNDFIKIFTNYALLIVVIALSILPSLYAWINIKASWDPYSSEATGRLKISIANNDKGTTFNDLYINLGNKLVDELKNNETLGWEFLSSSKSEEKLKFGKVYANIEVPEDFSKDLLSFVTNDIKKPKLIYIINEKLNAIAPKITSKGADTIQNTINEEIIKTISTVLLNMARDAGINIEENIMPKFLEASKFLHEALDSYDTLYKGIDDSKDKVNSIENFVSEISLNVPKIEEILNNADTIMESLDNYIVTIQGGLNSVLPLIKKNIDIASSISESLNSTIENLNNEEVLNSINNIKDNLTDINNIIKGTVDIMESINNLAHSDVLSEIISSIREKEEKLNNILKNDFSNYEGFNDISEGIKDINKLLSYINENFDSQISPEINSILNNSLKTISSINKIIRETKNELPSIVSAISSAKELLNIGVSGMDKLMEILPNVKEEIDDITIKIDNINSNKNITDLIELIKNNVSERIDYLQNPVEIENVTMYPMGNYGSQMAPFYSVLASWVGLTFLISMFKVNTSGLEKSYEVYFGKMGLFMAISIIQGFIIALGDLYFLKINCKFPVLFIISMIITSIVFTIIVYTLVSVFANVGKVIAIILMILQVAGSGGTFPIQLTSNFFIKLNPYLPFTYAISLLRESIGGPVKEIILYDIFCLTIFSIIALLIGVILKKYINKVMNNFTDVLEESNLVQ